VGVKEVWLFDPETREVDIWVGPSLPDRTFTANDILTSALLPGLELSLAKVFA
jgi:Uma2 family endonuclease